MCFPLYFVQKEREVSEGDEPTPQAEDEGPSAPRSSPKMPRKEQQGVVLDQEEAMKRSVRGTIPSPPPLPSQGGEGGEYLNYIPTRVCCLRQKKKKKKKKNIYIYIYIYIYNLLSL